MKRTMLDVCGAVVFGVAWLTACGASKTASEAPAASPEPAAGDRQADDELRAAPSEEEAGALEPEPELTPGEPSKSEMEGPDELHSQLSSASAAFDSAIGAERLSCDGARPHRDVICDLAERICRSAEEHPSPGAANQCADARDRCTDARRRFDEACGE